MAIGRVGDELHFPAALETGNGSLSSGFAQMCSGILEDEINIFSRRESNFDSLDLHPAYILAP